MLSMLTHQIQVKASRTAQTAVLGLFASICLIVGLCFFTAAAWLFLLTVTTALMTAIILGSAYFGIGLILLAVMSSRSRAKRQEQAAAAAYAAKTSAAGTDFSSIIAAFMTGLSAGKKARS